MDKRLMGALQYLMGIYAIIQALSLVPNPLSLIAYDTQMLGVASIPMYLVATVGPACVLLLGGVYLVVRNHRLTFADRVADHPNPPAVSSAGIHSSVLSAAGLLLLVLALKELPSVLSKVYAAYEIKREGMSFTQSGVKAAWIGCIGPCLQLSLGLLIFWKSSTLATYLRRRHDRTTVTEKDAQCPNCGFWVISKDYAPTARAYRCDNCKEEIPKQVIEHAGG